MVWVLICPVLLHNEGSFAVKSADGNTTHEIVSDPPLIRYKIITSATGPVNGAFAASLIFSEAEGYGEDNYMAVRSGSVGAITAASAGVYPNFYTPKTLITSNLKIAFFANLAEMQLAMVTS